MKNPKVFMEHILESIKFIEDYIKGKTKKDFLKTKIIQDSIIRRIEIIGEAIKNISDEVKEKYTDIPWKKIAGMRDLLIHEYFGVDLDLTWKVIEKDIPELKKEILKIKKDLI